MIRSRREALKTMLTKLDDAFLDIIDRIKSQPSSRKEKGVNTLAWGFLAESYCNHSIPSIIIHTSRLHNDASVTKAVTKATYSGNVS